MLLRFYEPDQGSITIGSKPLQLYSLNQLRRNISYVQQDVFLFSDTVANNIRFGVSEHTTIERVIEAAKSASIHEEILGFENGYETLIGERGVTLSGGQKQRISIARALLKEHSMILFDDCLSAVDMETEEIILKNLYQASQNKTTIIVSHRVSSVKHADYILVLEEGKILEQGSHNELVNLQGTYANLLEKQLQEKEMK